MAKMIKFSDSSVRPTQEIADAATGLALWVEANLSNPEVEKERITLACGSLAAFSWLFGTPDMVNEGAGKFLDQAAAFGARHRENVLRQN